MDLDYRKDFFDLLSLRFQPGRQHQCFAQRILRLVDRKSWRIGGELEENASWLKEIDRAKIDAISNRRHIQICVNQSLLPIELRVIVPHTEGYVVDRAGSHL